MTTNNIKYLKDNGIVFVENGSQFYEFIDSQWVSIGSFTENYTSVKLDSDGDLEFTFESDYDPVQNAFTPLLNLTGNDNSNSIINYTLTAINPQNSGGIINSISGSGAQFTINPNKVEDDLFKTQIIKIETDAIPNLGFDSADSDYFSFYGINKLEAKLSYDYFGASITETNHPKISNLISIITPAVEYMAFSSTHTGQNIKGIHFKSDGLTVYTVRTISSISTIEQYDLTKAYDVTTVDNTTYKKYEFYQSLDDQISDLFLSLNGDKLFLTSSLNAKIYELDLSTPYDVSTAVFESSEFINSKVQISNSLVGGNDFEIVDSGKRLFTLSNNVLYSWNIGDSAGTQAYDVVHSGRNFGGTSTNYNNTLSLGGFQQRYDYYFWANAAARNRGATNYFDVSFFRYFHYYLNTSANTSFTMSPVITNPQIESDGIIISPEETINYVYYSTGIAGADGRITQKKLTTPFDLNTSVNIKERKHAIGYKPGTAYVNDGNNSIQKIRWSKDGTQFYILDSYTYKIYSYIASTPFMLSSIGTSDNSTLEPISSSIKPNGGFDKQLDLSSVMPTNPAELSNINQRGGAVCVSGINYFDFDKDGTKLIVNNHKDVYEFSLSTAYDISTASHTNTYTNLDPYIENGSAVMIEDSDETNLYVSTSNKITQFSMDSFSDINDVVLRFDSDGINTSGLETSPTALMMNDSGTVVLFGGTDNNNIHKVTLSIPYKITSGIADSASAVTFNTPLEIDNLLGLTTNADFTKMFATSDNYIYQISINDSFFDLSSYDSIRYLTPQSNTVVNGLRWNNTGSEFTVSGDVNVERYRTKNLYQIIPI